MADRGFDPQRVTYSTTDSKTQFADPDDPSCDPLTSPPYVPGVNCGSLYGDSARVEDSSRLLAALGGAWGLFGNYLGTYQNGLLCPTPAETATILDPQQNLNPLISLPILHPTPNILDVHAGPCRLAQRHGPLYPNDPNRTVTTCKPDAGVDEVSAEAAAEFNAIQAFLASFLEPGAGAADGG